MKKNTLSFLMAFLSLVSLGFGQIVAWEMDGNSGDEAVVNATTLAENLNISTLSRGGGLSTRSLLNSFSSDSFTSSGTQANSIINDDYLQFQVSASPGYQFSLSTLDVNFRRSSTGPDSFIWRYSDDGINFTDMGGIISYTSTNSTGLAQAQIDLSSISELQNVSFETTITFRLYGWNASSTVGTFAIGRRAGNDLSLGGSVTTLPPCGLEIVTWDGANWIWDGGTPINTVPTMATTSNVIINGNYDTSTGSFQTSFSACSLTLTSAGNLTIADNTFVEVQNNLTVDSGGTINVQPQGAFIQNNDLGNVVNNGSISVDKVTALMDAWYEYTYWSSPVSGETIAGAIVDSEPTRRFIFNGQNFLDATEETLNNNATFAGQDDIDDDANDWQWVSGTTEMQPGVGYATTLTEFAFDIALGTSDKTFRFTFTGDFNNGVIDVPIYRNDSELNDNNWNFIGNPYPSAIDADAFLAANANVQTGVTNSTGAVDGALFLWSQNTLPSATANGNEDLNFSDADYAIINGTGGTAGGDNVMPNRFIPSGQGFFISMSNSAPASILSGDIYESSVTFNNGMRVFGAIENSQFFKSSNSKNNATSNKLWLNLTSDNGIFNQTLVGYVNGATNADDGSYYDAKKMDSPNIFASLYSIIENSDKKFGIQGKASNSLNEDEIIQLGFSTKINVATLYKLSIAQLQGDFLTNNPIYLKDNVLNKTHDLSASDYTFTSEVGEFNSRFSIVFSANSLAIEDTELGAKSLRIIELENDLVQFNVADNLSIQTVSIYDLLGRQLYDLKGNSASETYNLSNLNHDIYIAKVELSNGAVMTKKAVKR